MMTLQDTSKDDLTAACNSLELTLQTSPDLGQKPRMSLNPQKFSNLSHQTHHMLDHATQVLDSMIEQRQTNKSKTSSSSSQEAILSSFGDIFSDVSSVLSRDTVQSESILNNWTQEVEMQICAMSKALKDESAQMHRQADQSRFRDRALRCVQLVFSSTSVFLNTSSINNDVLRMLNIALTVSVGFLSGVEGIFKYNKRAYQYVEASLALDGLSRTLNAQLATPKHTRRDPTELILFIEKERDKAMKKLIET